MSRTTPIRRLRDAAHATARAAGACLIVLPLVLPAPARGQAPSPPRAEEKLHVGFGIRGGGSTSSFTGQLGERVNRNHGSETYGIYVALPLGHPLALLTGVDYSVRGGRYQESLLVYDTNGQVVGEAHQERGLQISYLEMPLMARWLMPALPALDTTRPYLIAGGSAAWRFQARYVSSVNSGTQPFDPNAVHRWDATVIGGAGVRVGGPGTKGILEMRYSRGLVDVLAPVGGPSGVNQTWILGLGLEF